MLFSSDVGASPLCLGTGSFGSDIDRDTSFRVLDTFVDAGGTFLDTAHIYAAWREGGWGASERTLGEWLRVNGNRKELVLGTKGGHPPLDRMGERRGSKECLERDLSESLERLGVDYVDIYWMHRDDPSREVGEMIETLAGFVRDGRIRSYGASNWTVDRIAAANAYAVSHDLPMFVASQVGYALAERPAKSIPVQGMLYMDRESREWYKSAGMAIAAYSAQATGYFSEGNTRWAREGFRGSAPNGPDYDTEENRRRLVAASEIGAARGLTANQVALAYLRNQSVPVYPVIGTRQVARVKEAMEAMHVSLTAEEMARLSDS